ncbi:hypothetical protein AB205_0106390 [Aquarana catesbeiana]|uniref:Uncharacterized protein n=1 Tax=Aquarana catesbeiana TaxID=8400 RepID=A0A2G9RZL3_AQUCT|nr:hypothetical protein AB205_0106390 [Aquarana catesbeiana]
MAAVVRINNAIRNGVAEETVQELMNPDAQLPEVFPFAEDLYQRELATLQQQSPEGNLTHPELSVAVEMLSSVALINRALDAGDVNTVGKQLTNPVTGLMDVEDENLQRYVDDLIKLKQQAREERNEFITWNDIQGCVTQVNNTVHEEHARILAIGLINEALDEGDAKKTLQALQLPAAKLEGVEPNVAQHYQDTLVRAKREKAQYPPPRSLQERRRGEPAAGDEGVGRRRTGGAEENTGARGEQEGLVKDTENTVLLVA